MEDKEPTPEIDLEALKAGVREDMKLIMQDLPATLAKACELEYQSFIDRLEQMDALQKDNERLRWWLKHIRDIALVSEGVEFCAMLADQALDGKRQWIEEGEMAEIKAIETSYNGYKFRSRLEARWAVFFDQVGIEYQYEPEGFDLNNDGYYLPDFYIKEFDIWLEVKPFRELVRIESLDFQMSDVDYNKFRSFHIATGLNGAMLFGDPFNFNFFSFHSANSKNREFYNLIDMAKAAAVYARSARFEHGERP